MRDARRVIRAATALVAGAALLSGLSACAHVKQEELHTELDQVREEMRQERQAEDRVLADRIDETTARVDGLARRVEDNAARLDALEADLRELEEEFAVTVERMEGMIAFAVPVHFEFDSATLREQDHRVLERFADVYTGYYDGKLLTVEGFTDEAGSDAYNERLGKRRAEGVKGYLAEVAGLDPERIRTVSYGESRERLVAPGEYGPNAGMENRRVTLVVETGGELSAAPAADSGS